MIFILNCICSGVINNAEAKITKNIIHKAVRRGKKEVPGGVKGSLLCFGRVDAYRIGWWVRSLQAIT